VLTATPDFQLTIDIQHRIESIFRCYTECPADWEYVSSVNGCYKLVNRNWSWNIAGQDCRSLHKDAHLIVINSPSEQYEIIKMLDNVNG